MSTRTIYEQECDNCGHVVQCSSQVIPDGWASVAVKMADNGSGLSNDAIRFTGLYCVECAKNLLGQNVGIIRR